MVAGASGRSRVCEGRLVSLRSGGGGGGGWRGAVVKPRICCAASVFMVCESQRRVKGRAGDADRAGLYLGNA